MHTIGLIEKIKILEDRIRKLEDQNEFYKNIITELPFGIQIFDKYGETILENKKQIEILGLPSKRKNKAKFNILTDPFAIATGSDTRYKKVYAGLKAEHEYECNMGMQENKWETRKDTRIFKEIITPIKNKKEEVEFVFTTVIDITKKRRAENRLKESKILFKTIFDLIDVGINISDKDGNIKECNKASEKILGYTKKDLLTKNYKDKQWNIVRPDLSPMPINEFPIEKAIAENKEVLNIEMGIVQQDGITWIMANAAPLKNEKQEIFVTYIDITDRKKEEFQRILFNRNFESFLTNTSDFIYFKDKKSRMLFCSQTMAEISGHKHWKHLVGKNDLELFPEDVAKIYMEEDNLVIKKKKPLLNYEEPYYNTDGNKRLFQTNKWPLFDENGNVTGIFGISRDITEKLKAEQRLLHSEQQLKKLNATKDKLFSIIAHDLRNPFNALISLNDLVYEKIKSNDIDYAKELIKHIQESSNQGLYLLENLLQWSRIQTGSFEYNPSSFCFNELVGNIERLLKASSATKQISITQNIAPDLNMIADMFMVETILRNLLTNAIKFTPEGGKIEISASVQKNNILVSVIDNGIGIPKDKLEKLFTLDSNYSSVGTKNERGTGLGLILCKEFIERHKGKIWVKSEENAGSTFSFTIKQDFS